jgi:DNA uptake protein ComE-like DNA-binding protein
MTPYTPRQLLLLLLVVLGAGVGLATGQWRRAHPDLVDRLERLDRPAAPAALPAPPAPPARTHAPRERARGASAGPRRRAAVPIDVNRAGERELATLPGVGATLAARIVAARAGGPFATLDDLRRVRGLGRVRLERLRPLVRLGP